MKGNYMSLDWMVGLLSSEEGGGGGERGGERWCGVVWRSPISTPELHQSLDVVIIEQILKIWGRKNGETEWIFISKTSAGQTCAHEAPLQVGGLEGSSAVKVKAPADEPAQHFCSTSGSLWGQRLAGGLYQHARELHGTSLSFTF